MKSFLERTGFKANPLLTGQIEKIQGQALVDLVEDLVLPATEMQEEDFDGINGKTVNPTNFCYNGEADFYLPVVSNDWRSVTLRLNEDTFVRIPKEMVYECC